jgi:vacuolar-type H+-ATPase subunit I/STV1
MRVDYDKDQLAYALANALKERDEARKELSSIHRWIERNHADGFIDSLTYFQNLDRITENWYDRLDRLEVDANRFERERDEAGKVGEAFSELAWNLEGRLNEARKLNAKLRDIAERATDDLAWFNETAAQKHRTELNRLGEVAK